MVGTGDKAVNADGGLAEKTKRNDTSKAEPKAPLDVEKQCSVELPRGRQYARSLICKVHSMNAKRAVPGRSALYDQLLVEYQRKD